MKQLIYLHILFFLYSLGGILSKFASKETFLSPKFIALYVGVIAILLAYAVLWQQCIKKLQLTTAYSNRAVCILWGILWGTVFFQEQVTIQMIVGAVLVIAGIIVVVITGDDATEGKER